MKAGVRYRVSVEDVERLIQKYTSEGGQMHTIDEGCLGKGTFILSNETNERLAEFVVFEVALNEWSCAHEIVKYLHGVPQKYWKAANKYLNQIMSE
jgi:hypothetical protein